MHNNILDKNYFMVKSNINLLSTSLILFYYLTFSGFRCNQKSPTWVGLLLSLVYQLSVSTAVHVIAVLLRAFTSILLPFGYLFVSTYPDVVYLSWMEAAPVCSVVASSSQSAKSVSYCQVIRSTWSDSSVQLFIS